MKARTWISAFRRHLTEPRSTAQRADGSLLLGQQDQAYQATDSALGALRAALAITTTQDASLARLDQDLRLLGTRSTELANALDLTRDALERCRLLALNAGLEGARLGEAAGRALLALSDEIRTVAARGLEVLGEHAAGLGQQTRAQEKLVGAVELAQRQNSSIGDELVRAEQAQLEARRALAELATELQRGMGSDPEVARIAGSAATHLHAVATALGGLSSREQRQAAVEALRPSLQPLLRWLAEHEEQPPGRT